MIYDFKCGKCGSITEQVRRVDDRDDHGKCDCGGVTRRIFTFNGSAAFGTFKEGHYHAFGKTLTSAHQLKEELRRHKGETGQELVEVGNERIKTKAPRKAIDWDGFGKELRSKWQS